MPSSRRLSTLAATAVALLMTGAAHAAPGLQSAVAAVTFTSPAACEVTLTLAITGATDVEHRLAVMADARAVLVGVEGATFVQPPQNVGRTLQLRVTPPAAGPYTIRYRVTQPDTQPYRCPLWLPTVAADGRSRRVGLEVTVPDGASAGGTMPAFVWNGHRGRADLPHLPAVVIVPFAAAGASRPWDVARLMDAAAIATLVLGSAMWLHRQQRRARR